MSTQELSKINRLLSTQPQGVVLLSSWLTENGYSPELQKRYRKSKWLTSIGTGAMIRTGDQVDYLGAIYALQKQVGLSIHPGAKNALLLQGKAHYLEMGKGKMNLFGGKDETLPAWFKSNHWDVTLDYHATSFQPAASGLTKYETNNFSIDISGPVRAMMECLYLSPTKFDLIESYQLMEGLNALRPDQVQELLESCNSVKVKRLFLYMAEKAGHLWFSKINLNNIDLGSGKRSLVKNGIYISKYQITVPKELEINEKPEL
ncbi:MAG: type IV toxin-antitoxin system AbiEi family antitoxin [Saprospiraceae bacterium]|uniref:Type IV toxin-antitoxin system AbiEi family antitoxin n=1 Tax=Candidatus Opimibacter skivensis TaxID=2982028 RepID=A0A9D7XMT8_9BACT|nr:type IV toxin-antitoxin system AbiEi family antitoxin [Candidatus Opimibacter skivensis]